MKGKPKLQDFIILICAGILLIYLLFFFDNEKLVLSETSPCDKSVSASIYSYKKRRSTSGIPIYHIYVRKNDRLIDKFTVLALFQINWNRDTKVKKKLIWDCKNRTLRINGVNEVKF